MAAVLSYVWQLESEPPILMEVFERALIKLAPGPGLWVTKADLRLCGFSAEFPDPHWTALAAKTAGCKYSCFGLHGKEERAGTPSGAVSWEKGVSFLASPLLLFCFGRCS